MSKVAAKKPIPNSTVRPTAHDQRTSDEGTRDVSGDVPEPPQPPAVRTLEGARALPIVEGDEGSPVESDDPTVILAFKGEDGRTYRVVNQEGHLAATLVEN